MAASDAHDEVEPAGDERAARAVAEPMAVEQIAPSMVRVVTLSDTYRVDTDLGACTCPDYQYGEHECKHIVRARVDLNKTVVPPIGDVVHDLEERTVRADGGCPDCGDDLACFEHFDGGRD